MKTLITAALLGTIAAGGIAYAQTTPPPAPMAKPLKGDANSDGRVTRAEFLKQAETRFARLDVNRDGTLTREEARAGHRMGGKRGPGAAGRYGAVAQDGTPPAPGMGGQRMGGGRRGGGMMRLDTDGDGRVTRAEFDAQSGAMFARMDTNRDGTVDKAEMAALPGGGRMATRADRDGSGTLTRAEYDAQSTQRFARMDMNSDGVIDAAELQSRPMGGRGQRRAAPPAPPVAPTPPAPTPSGA